MFRQPISTFLIIALAGCGGASTSVQQPFSSRGFANETSVAAPPGGATVTVRQTPRLLSQNGQNLRIEDQDIVFRSRLADDRVFIDVELDGTTFALAQVGDNELFQQLITDDTDVILEPFALAQNVALSNLFASVIDENDE